MFGELIDDSKTTDLLLWVNLFKDRFMKVDLAGDGLKLPFHVFICSSYNEAAP